MFRSQKSRREVNTLVELDTPMEPGTPVEQDAPMESDTPVEHDAPMEVDTPVEPDVSLEPEAPVEQVTQVSSIKMVLTCDAGTKIESNLFRDAATQRTDVGDPEKEETHKRIAALKKIMEEEDRHTQELRAKIEMLKERRKRHRGPVTE
jgi:hypothetical protein